MLLVLASCTASHAPSQFASNFSVGPVRGFQIQIHSTQYKATADSTVDTASGWWNDMDEEKQRALFGVRDLPIEIKWLDPYYRVRIGHFRSREEARAVLDIVAEKFPAAFIVPDTML